MSFLLAGCGASPSRKRAIRVEKRPAQAKLEAIDSPSMQFLPRLDQAPGWHLEGDPIVYPPTGLPGYMALEARHFLLYDVSDLTVGQYSHPGTPAFATVEIFRFPDFVKAFGAYSTRRPGKITLLDIPNESFAARHSIHIWRGAFYVRVTGGGTPDAMQALRALAGSAAERMPVATSGPAVFAFLPDKLRIPHSEQFDAQSGMGQPYLRDSFTAQYNVNGTVIDGLILPARDRAAAAHILDQFKAFFVANGKMLDPVPNLGEDNFTAEDRTFGRVVALRLDRFIIAFRGYGDRQSLVDLAALADQRILGTIRKELVNADKAAERPPSERIITAPPWAGGSAP